ncbi:cellulose biosynthesis cyclic di-GMP-binding regulatory protein BcsB [Candidatus Symbiobacter mobilis]|nr:cellulose biosynthesis cyclic di-GMP-binding regulatory protein BcsB [Candidatus Symbiobacter mobilis]
MSLSSFLHRSFRCLSWALILGIACTSLSAEPRSKSRRKAPVQEEIVETAVPEASATYRKVSLSFKDMGAWSSVHLRGADASRTLTFSVRSDEMVVAAKLSIVYDYSPSLIPEWSHLRILLNERVSTVFELPAGKNLGNRREIDLDPRWFADANFLRFHLIAHYTRQCENMFHTSLWLTLNDIAKLELTLAPKTRTNDLKYLPAPFFDKFDDAMLKLPFVFPARPSRGAVQAAGIVASWFSIQAGARGAQFPVSLGTLPEGNAVVFTQGMQGVPGVNVPADAHLSVITHPNNPLAKLLVFSGVQDADLLRAARTLALVSATLAGPAVRITQETPMEERVPYDAPAWVPSHRPVRFGELAKPEELRVHGWYPEVIRLNYRVSPDVFTWRTKGVPMQLRYRFLRLPEHKNSSLNVSLNNHFLHAFPLNAPWRNPDDVQRLNLPGSDNVSRRSDLLYIPPYAVGGKDQLQMAFFFDIIQQGECQAMPPDNLQAAIDPESTMDFSVFPRYVALPNLAHYANIGFPFTRMADLSETAVLLPDAPNAFELGAYLMAMGRFGEATGYPVLRHSLLTAAEVEQASGMDMLVIGSANSQTLMTLWADKLPVVSVSGERRVREPDATWLPKFRWEEEDVHAIAQPRGKLNLAGRGELTTLIAFESPLEASRSVVLIHADKAADLQKVGDLLTNPERIGQIQGDLVVIDDKALDAAKVSATYYLGSLAWKTKLGWLLEDHPTWVGIGVALLCILAALAAYRPTLVLLRRLVPKRKV